MFHTIVIFSLFRKMENVTKNKVFIYNKAGRLLEDKFYFDENYLEMLDIAVTWVCTFQ